MLDIYIKPIKKANSNKRDILLKDIADVACDEKIIDKVKNVRIFQIKNDKPRCYLVTSLDMISILCKHFSGYKVQNLGEPDTIIDFDPNPKKVNKVFEWVKITVVCLVLITGAATAIMSFHSDSQMAQVFKNYYYIFFNQKVENPAIIDIPYSIGMAVGIMVFFNHFGDKKFTKDPTPIEVELTVYENQTADSIIDSLNCEKRQEGSND